ncbi:MAG: hydrolase 2, exosortase A system-associated [Candidatus Binatia bacterium]
MARAVSRPFFLPGVKGRLFALAVTPDTDTFPAQGILYFPPFAEEMNKSRRMASLQARRLARRGYAVLLVDPYGTGDSEGEFGDARWELWQEDMRTAARWLAAQGSRLLIAWSLRLGALLALDTVGTLGLHVERCIFWQPLVRGDRAMVQFLRLQIAADMATERKSTLTDLRARLAGNESLEIAGYKLAPELWRSIEGLPLPNWPTGACENVEWIEIAADWNQGISQPNREIIDRWRERGVIVNDRTVPGEPFWQTTEIVEVPALVDSMDEILLGPGIA